MQYLFNCRVCKAKRNHMIVQISELLPPNTKTVECVACGTLSVRLIHEPTAAGESGELRDGQVDWDGIER